MRLDFTLLYLSIFGSAAAAVIQEPEIAVRHVQPSDHEFWKRRGGGGGGGRSGGGSSGGSSSGGSSGGSSSGSSGGRTGSGSGSGSSGGSSSSGKGGTSSSSSVGGTSKTGSGARPAYGGGRYYGGGAAVPYSAGSRSRSGISPLIFPIAALAFWPGIHPPYGSYIYDYGNDKYKFYNSTTKKDETLPIFCACARYAVCGCDDNKDRSYLKDLIGNGSYSALNKSVIDVGSYKGTKHILLNGTLPNGTTSADSAAPNLVNPITYFGLGPAVIAILATTYFV